MSERIRGFCVHYTWKNGTKDQLHIHGVSKEQVWRDHAWTLECDGSTVTAITSSDDAPPMPERLK